MKRPLTQVEHHHQGAIYSLGAARRHQERGDLEEAQLCYASAIMDIELAMGVLELEKRELLEQQ